MRRLSLAAAIALFALGSAGTASAQVKNCNQGNQAAGTIVGAVLGGTVGGVIANDRRGFNSRRGFRGSRFNSRRGFRGSNQGLGIVLGALAGGVVGNQIAGAKNQNCNSFARQRQSNLHSGQSLSGGSIDYNARRLGDPYGGQRIVDQTQPVSANPVVAPRGQVPQPASNQGVFQPVCQNAIQTTRLPDGQVLNEPIEFCQFSPGGEWIQR